MLAVRSAWVRPAAVGASCLVFLAGLVIHGGLQQGWIEPRSARLTQVPLMLGATALTAFDDGGRGPWVLQAVSGITSLNRLPGATLGP